MKQFLAFITIVMLTAGFCRAEGFELTGKTETCTAKVTFLEGQPVKGSNRVKIDIVDASSRYVKDARVEIEYFMPSLPGRPSMMDYHTTAKGVGDSYEATLKLDMPGEWKMTLSVARTKRTEKATVGFVVR
jgi:hypothetical protein